MDNLTSAWCHCEPFAFVILSEAKNLNLTPWLRVNSVKQSLEIAVRLPRRPEQAGLLAMTTLLNSEGDRDEEALVLIPR